MTTEDVNPCDRETLIDYAVHRCDTANKLAEHHSWRAIACLSTGDTGGDAALREALRYERRWQIFVAVIRDMRKCSFTRGRTRLMRRPRPRAQMSRRAMCGSTSGSLESGVSQGA